MAVLATPVPEIWAWVSVMPTIDIFVRALVFLAKTSASATVFVEPEAVNVTASVVPVFKEDNCEAVAVTPPIVTTPAVFPFRVFRSLISAFTKSVSVTV